MSDIRVIRKQTIEKENKSREGAKVWASETAMWLLFTSEYLNVIYVKKDTCNF